MSKTKIFIFFLAFFRFTSLFSQETILLKGKISADSLDGSSIYIINLTKQTAESPGFSEIIIAGKHLDLLANYCKNASIFLKQLKEKNKD